MTQPAVAYVDGDPVVIVASLMLDATHPSGISAHRVVMDGETPRFETHWQVPDFASAEAIEVFRNHPGRPVIGQRGRRGRGLRGGGAPRRALGQPARLPLGRARAGR
ncbi:MAG: hypothetical protein M5U28_36315 [Sandaracinaceae bacterium]|nr:hypothetical protein [Sandaracinaceae bacterium]